MNGHVATSITLPFANIFEFDEDRIEGCCIYIDVASLYATTP